MGAGRTCRDRAAGVIGPRRRPRLPTSWRRHLEAEFDQPYMRQLGDFLRDRLRVARIYPPGGQIFEAFALTDFEAVRVVVLGQDPYHGPGQAHGLCFSVLPGVGAPPSLRNILRETQRDVGVPPPTHGCLRHWAEQGVLLLNSVLTVEAGRPGSHRQQGWERFSDCVVQLLDRECEGLVFMLWGSYARERGRLVDRSRHLVLETSHPSPLSAARGFLGCGHFSRANDWLSQRGSAAIDWSLPPLQDSASG